MRSGSIPRTVIAHFAMHASRVTDADFAAGFTAQLTAFSSGASIRNQHRNRRWWPSDAGQHAKSRGASNLTEQKPAIIGDFILTANRSLPDS